MTSGIPPKVFRDCGNVGGVNTFPTIIGASMLAVVEVVSPNLKLSPSTTPFMSRLAHWLLNSYFGKTFVVGSRGTSILEDFNS